MIFMRYLGLACLVFLLSDILLVGMLIAEFDVTGCLEHIRCLSDRNSKMFALLQFSLLASSLYLGTIPYQITLGSTAASMWMPLFWLSPWIWLTAGAGCLMLSLLTWKSFQQVLSTRLCLFIGRISFAIYLLHYQVLIITDIMIMPYLGPALNPPGSNDRTAAAFICYFLFILPVTIGASYCFHIYVDEVSITYSNDFTGLLLENFPIFCKCLRVDRRVRSTTLGPAETDDSLVVINPLGMPTLTFLRSHRISLCCSECL